MTTTHASLDMLEEVARAMGDIEVVFVGGATLPLYVTPDRVLEIRPTDDVDCVVEVTTRTGYYAVEAGLRVRGFTQRIDQRAGPVCRWWLGDLAAHEWVMRSFA